MFVFRVEYLVGSRIKVRFAKIESEPTSLGWIQEITILPVSLTAGTTNCSHNRRQTVHILKLYESITCIWLQG